MMLVLLAAAVAPAPADTIAPPLGRTLRVVSVEVRNDGRSARTFRVERDVVFAADGDGFRATVTTRSAQASGDKAEARRFATANAPLLGRAIVMHLDRRGAVRTIESLDEIWAAWTAGLAATAPAGRDKAADTMRDRLAALPLQQRMAMFGSMISKLLAPPEQRVASPARAITLASPAPFAGTPLAGTSEVVSVDGRVRVHASGQANIAATGGRPGAEVSVTTDRLIDPVSGLVLDDRQVERTVLPHGTLTVQTTTSLTPGI